MSLFKAKTKTERILAQEMLFADDNAIVAHTAKETQVLLDRFKSAARNFRLIVNIMKAECFHQPSNRVMSVVHAL